jgi:nitroreductase
MELESAIRERRSIRAFSAEPVCEHTVRELLDIARWAPSWANTQNWSIYIVSGEPLEKIKAAYRAKAESKAERHFDLPAHKPEWPAHLRARTQQLFATRQAALGGDASKPPPFPADFFGAPYLAFFAIDSRLQPEYAAFDCGLLVQTFCLAAQDKGLGTCIMAMAVAYGDVLREVLSRTEGKRFVVGVALGVPDRNTPVNQFERQRAELEEFVTWVK